MQDKLEDKIRYCSQFPLLVQGEVEEAVRNVGEQISDLIRMKKVRIPPDQVVCYSSLMSQPYTTAFAFFISEDKTYIFNINF